MRVDGKKLNKISNGKFQNINSKALNYMSNRLHLSIGNQEAKLIHEYQEMKQRVSQVWMDGFGLVKMLTEDMRIDSKQTATKDLHIDIEGSGICMRVIQLIQIRIYPCH